jgi:hypothetical protein
MLLSQLPCVAIGSVKRLMDCEQTTVLTVANQFLCQVGRPVLPPTARADADRFAKSDGTMEFSQACMHTELQVANIHSPLLYG